MSTRIYALNLQHISYTSYLLVVLILILRATSVLTDTTTQDIDPAAAASNNYDSSAKIYLDSSDTGDDIDEINIEIKNEDDKTEPEFPSDTPSEEYSGRADHYLGSGSNSDTAIANIYQESQEESQSVSNMTSNATSTANNSTKPVKTTVSCIPRELLIENDTVVEPVVEIVNFTKLTQDVLYINSSIKTKSTPANCSIVYFYTHWCKFSAKAAAHVNALARVFPSIRTVAIDCSLQTSVNSHFGVLSVPTILLFHNGKTIAKFNDSVFTLSKFAEFIQYFTDQKYEEKVLNVTSKDFHGPISSVPSQERDIWLAIAWIFIIICFIYFTSRSILWRRVVDLIRTTWREAEAQHEHLD